MYVVNNRKPDIFTKNFNSNKFSVLPKVIKSEDFKDEQGRKYTLLTLEIYCIVNQRDLVN